MNNDYLRILATPKLQDATLLLALTGWMDGGLVSTGTVRRLMEDRDTQIIARIAADPFYIFNFPGSMEVAALFRPAAKYEDGLLTDVQMPENEFYCDAAANLVFFLGHEPNLCWQAFADSIFEVSHQVGVKRIVFVGSFGGRVPHTREPRMYGSVSAPHLKPLLEEHHVEMSSYEGPCGISTLLMAQAGAHGIDMLSFVAEIPGYLQGRNPLSIEAVTRRLARLLNQPVNFDRLRADSNDWEAEVSEAVARDPEFAAKVRKDEERYDNQLIGRATEPEEDEEAEEDEEEE